MKHTLKFSLALGLILAGLLGFSAPRDAEKRAVIEKKYALKTDVAFHIENQFGDIHVESWDKNELAVKVEIVVRARNDEKALRLMERIDIDIDESSDMIAFETIVDSHMDSKNESVSFEINYTVHMNPKNPIYFENKFGDVYIPFRQGYTQLDIEYGSLKSEGAEGEFELELSFGKAEIGNLRAAEMEVDYSDVVIASVDELVMQQKFSKVEVEWVGVLELETKYGDILLGEVGAAEVEGHFSGFRIRKLKDRLVLEGNYISGFEITELSKGFSLVDLSGQFSTYKIYLQPGLSANIEAEFSFADINHSGVPIDFHYRDVDGNTREYKGKINGGSPQSLIRVNSSYGNLKLYQ